jgi:hypothetical protein
MTEFYRFVFFREDLPIEQIAIQAGHAIDGVASILHQDYYSAPNLVYIGVPDVRALNRVLAKLKANQIRHYPWVEPDFGYGFTSIATEPLTEERKEVLSNYRVWRYGSGTGQPACGVNPDAPANSRVV